MPEVCDAWMVAGPTELSKDWNDALEEMGVDKACSVELFCYSQLDEEAFMKANESVAKMLKKWNDGTVLHNPSAFLHNGIMTARYGEDWKNLRKYWKSYNQRKGGTASSSSWGGHEPGSDRPPWQRDH